MKYIRMGIGILISTIFILGLQIIAHRNLDILNPIVDSVIGTWWAIPFDIIVIYVWFWLPIWIGIRYYSKENAKKFTKHSIAVIGTGIGIIVGIIIIFGTLLDILGLPHAIATIFATVGVFLLGSRIPDLYNQIYNLGE